MRLAVSMIALTLASACGPDAGDAPASDPAAAVAAKPVVVRLLDEPIISPATHPSLGANIQGPSLIKAPDWIEAPLGRYYLYFADHKGAYIRLAYSNDLTGPWTVHPEGSLRLDQTPFPQTAPSFTAEEMAAFEERAAQTGLDLAQFPDVAKEMTTPHIASPDVIVDEPNKRLIMYYHGLEGFARQVTRAAVSNDGVNFEAQQDILGRTYWRAFQHGGMTYALTMPGQVYRSSDRLSGFEAGPLLFAPNMRHSAVMVRGDTLHVIWTEVGGPPPERLLHSTIDLSGDWMSWKESPPVEILRPERPWEGADLPLTPSVRSFAPGPVNQLRDPALFEEDGRAFLVYSIARESGLGIAEITFPPS